MPERAYDVSACMAKRETFEQWATHQLEHLGEQITLIDESLRGNGSIGLRAEVNQLIIEAKTQREMSMERHRARRLLINSIIITVLGLGLSNTVLNLKLLMGMQERQVVVPAQPGKGP